MTPQNLLRWFFAVVFALIFACADFFHSQRELENDILSDKPRYFPLMASQLLPGVLITLAILMLWHTGPKKTAETMFSFCFPIFLQICIYQLLLLALLPLLRRWFRARTCALLWLLPNYLYLTQHSFLYPTAPRWVWHVPKAVVTVGLIVWVSGAAVVMLWHILSHLVFRRSLLKTCREVTDPETLRLWQQAQADARVRKPDYRLLISPDIASPLSIGMFRRTIRVVLPEQDYTPEDLQLIFRHELVHIGREDSSAKFFLVFCTAMCWFNPLMWIAKARSAEDLELSCDETVLLDCTDAERRRYAQLLLQTAADPRGFTTCLSASAEALRHRLKHVIHPGKRLGGSLLIGVCFLVLLLGTGHVALAYEVGDGSEEIYRQRSLSEYSVNHISARDADGYQSYLCTEESSLLQYFSQLRLSKVTGLYEHDPDEPLIITLLQTPEGVVGLNLREHTLDVVRLYKDKDQTTSYYLAEPADLHDLRQWMEPEPQEPEVPTDPPDLMLYFNEQINPDGSLMYAEKQVLKCVENGTVVSSGEALQEQSIGGVHGLLPDKVELVFSVEPAEPFTVTIAPLDGSAEKTLSSEEMDDFFVLLLEPYSAQYTIHAAFEPTDNIRYEMEYRFVVTSN